jgi:DNA-binding beta-propeller fold protein YncE
MGQFKYPYGIAIDDKDVLYVIDAFNYRIQKLSADLKFLSEWGSQESIGFRLYMPHEIALTPTGNIILSDRQNHRISVFSGDGVLVTRFGKFGEGKDSDGNQFSEPHGVAVNNSGEIFVCDRYNYRIRKFSPGGDYITSWFTSGNFDNSKHFPLGITVIRNGTVYITDHYAHCVQKY